MVFTSSGLPASRLRELSVSNRNQPRKDVSWRIVEMSRKFVHFPQFRRPAGCPNVIVVEIKDWLTSRELRAENWAWP